MPENPAEWRSTVDPTSGRTYWYHRKTRVSTWVRPDFDDYSSVAIGETAVSVGISMQDSAIDDNVGDDHTDESLSALQRVAQNPNEADAEDLSLLLQSLHPFNNLVIKNAAVIITSLVGIAVQASDGHDARQTALRCLFTLSSNRQFAGIHFYRNQSWLNLSQQLPKWPDAESGLTLCGLYCNLMVGPPFRLWGGVAGERQRQRQALCDYLEGLMAQVGGADSVVHFELLCTPSCANGVAVLDDGILQLFSLLADQGHRLPALWLLTVFSQSFR